MSAVNYLHSSVEKHVEGDKRNTREEFIIHGDKGFTAKYYHKDNKEEIKVVVAKKDDKYVLKTKMGDKQDEKLLTKAELIKELGKHKELKFVVDYLSKAKDLSRSKKGSKKGSKKSSKKGSKKGGSKKSSKKGSNKGSKKVMKGGDCDLKGLCIDGGPHDVRERAASGTTYLKYCTRCDVQCTFNLLDGGAKKSSKKGSKKVSKKGSKKY
jgi:hypothetical protein